MLKRLSTLRHKKRDSVASADASAAPNAKSNGQSNGASTDGNGYAAHGTTNVAHDGPATKADGASPVNGASSGRKPSFMKRASLPAAVKRTKTDEEKGAPTRHEVDSSLEDFAQLVHASRRPLPIQNGDGTYVEHEVHSSLFQDMKALGFKDVQTLMNVMKNKAAGGLIDDKTMIMEKTIQLVASLPPKSKTRSDLTNAFIDELWYSLEHPPLNHLGDEYNYRKADGSGNNPLFPQLGAANTAYARSVLPETIQPGSLPDPGLIFDALYKRGKYREHPNKVSSILYYWAGIIIHDLFQTNHHDFSLSQTSSYLDLSVLYGDDQADQDQIRTFKDGKIKPDCFAEQRIYGMPPATGILLIMFNRFHNYVAEQLVQINEGGRFTKPRDDLEGEAKEKAWKKYDNDLFQTARLITCGLYMNITLLDYLRTIVNLNRSNTTWTLDPRTKMGKTTLGTENAPRGVGNQVSAEFNLVYRWHSNISAKDEKWTEGLFQQLFGKPGSEVGMQELLFGLGKWEKSMDPDPFKRPFSGLKRGPDGKFDDSELVSILCDSIEDPAGATGARHVPACMKAIEILGMQQARAWRLGTLNEFRKFFGLKTYETFEEINPDEDVANCLRHLYEHPDYVEMYPGIVAEEDKKPMVPGVGICPTYTISRAILSDAVTLVRADRFYTTDYHAKNLTNWGYSEVQYDLNVEQGCVFYKLFLRAFPNHFKSNSIYAHYPMTVPSENHKIMTSLGRVDHYDYERPGLIPPRINLTSFGGADYMLNRPQDFKVTWGAATGFVMGKGGLDFMLSGDTPFHTRQKETMAAALYKENWHKEIKAFYEYITLQLLHQKSAKIAGINQVDITRDVGNIAHVHFAANIFNLPLKTEENPKGVFTEHELYAIVAVIFIAIFFDFEPTKSFPLRMAAQALGQKLGKTIEMGVKSASATGWVSGLVDGMRENHTPLKEYGIHMVRKLLESGLGVYEVAWSQILPVATAMIPNQAQVFTQALDFYLSPEGAEHFPALVELAKQDTEASDELMMKYVMEGIRLFGTFGSYRESVVSTTIDDNGRAVPIKPGDKVFCSFVSANRDPARFPEPDKVRTDRPLEDYIHYGIGPHKCLGMEASRVGLTAMFKTVLRSCPNLRRAPGAPGQMKKIPRPGGFYVYMTEQHSSYFPFPTTWKLHYDGELPALPKPSK